MKSVYLYPPASKGGCNPYCRNYKDSLKNYFIVRDLNNKVSKIKTLPLLRYSFNTDVFIFNWIESVGNLKFGFVQFLLTLMSLFIIKCRRKKIIWMFHNIHPHEGENFCSKIMRRIMFTFSDNIISHSKEAALYAQKYANCKVDYICHPIPQTVIGKWDGPLIACDIFIWGWITPYKGIPEFLSSCKEKLRDKKILILGKSKDDKLADNIRNYANRNVVFIDRQASFEEIAAYVRKAKYTVFPYIGNSISSSGVLLDTLVMGGNPVGPKRAAFKDMSEDGLCIVYNSYDELIDILHSNDSIDESKRNLFFQKNTWNNMVKLINQRMK